MRAIDIDTGKVVIINNVFSGNSSNPFDSQTIRDVGPVPIGKYLIGNGYHHVSSPGDNWWYRLYGDDGNGGFSYTEVIIRDNNGNIIKDSSGTPITRGGFNLHTGLASNGCVTVPSETPRSSPSYPASTKYDELKKLLDNTKVLEYNGSTYTGKLTITNTDNDRDGIDDARDTDDDNDGTPDTIDAFPLDPLENTDTDGDGIGNNADTDDDGDGTPDSTDSYPLDPDRDDDSNWWPPGWWPF